MNLSAPGSAAEECSALPGFYPMKVLWEGEQRVYPSEWSARWVFSQNRQALVQANAVAFQRGRYLIHQERFRAVVEKSALDEARRRLGCAPASSHIHSQPTVGSAA